MTHIDIKSEGGFAENKDEAKILREKKILPTLERGGIVILNFKEVEYATQSFVHALIGEALQRYREDVLQSFEFQNCSPQLRSLIELVVDYSLGGFQTEKVA